MHESCMFCARPLGRNEVVEHFPVGRRLAFDARRGRLWVVCRKCERWNLTPLEERWEAVETCERMFRDTRVRVSTENVGLARHLEALELVRIGKPLRPDTSELLADFPSQRTLVQSLLAGDVGEPGRPTR